MGDAPNRTATSVDYDRVPRDRGRDSMGPAAPVGPAKGGPAMGDALMGGPTMGGPVMGDAAMGGLAIGAPTIASSPPRNGALGITSIPDTLALPSSAAVKPLARAYDNYRVSVDQYVTFHRQGFLIVRGLVPLDDVVELADHVVDVVRGTVEAPGLEPPPPGSSLLEIERRYLRIHMLHRVLEIHERFMLHPRVLDVLEALIGPDLLAMQTMLFIKPPGGAGPRTGSRCRLSLSLIHI